MNSVTAIPQPQVLLSSSMATMVCMEETKVLTWQRFYALLNQQPWRRMVKREQDGNLDTLVLAGFFRLVKRPNQKVTLQRLSLLLDSQLTPTWSWVNCRYPLKFMMQSYQSALAWRFRSVLEFAIGAIVKDLEKQGVNALVVPVKTEKKSGYDGIDITPITTAHLDMGKPAKEWVSEQLSKQFGFLDQGITQGSRALYKHLWDFVDKEKLSLYLQIHQCALSEVSFGELHTFSQHVTDVARYQQHRDWLPWLSTFPSGQYRHYAHSSLFSYEHLQAHLPKTVSKGAIRKINRQPRQVQALLIKAKMWTPPALSLLDALSGYPATIQVRLLSRVQYQKASEYERLQRLVFRWAHYFKPMIGRVKVRKQKAQWERALMQFHDVLYWVEREDVVIHKNQTWYSLVAQHERWVARINAKRLKVDAQKDAVTWEAAQWQGFDTQGVQIKEITSGLELRSEGKDMEHCVFSYFDECVGQRYRVFSLVSDSERVTLGLDQEPVSRIVQYDQLRGARNDMSSQRMEQVAQGLIRRINVKSNGELGR
ncbi:PcfJ domain-containing protein [Vibrio hyugaensis]|uniref:PcfJ domain-containing protein n=1 Tax=Vibrio hyugaensis TaxID=1534743 RepID=UPI0005F084B2|nr:PcfJ domain-containing protein [Vibrio hyugaensis]